MDDVYSFDQPRFLELVDIGVVEAVPVAMLA
jgi:hypothetical protein